MRRLLLLPFLLLAGCGASAAAPAATPTLVPAAASGLQLEIASSDLSVGPNRFTFGLIDNNRPLQSGVPHLTFYVLRGQTGTAAAKATARFNYFSRDLAKTAENSAALQIGGVYVAHVTFSTAGNWGVEVRMNVAGKTQVLRQGFQVQKHSLSPGIGSPAPRSHNPTIYQEPATRLDSGRPPDDMHKLSIAQAIAQHKPLVVLFATAAYCTSRLCGPEIEVVQGLERRYRGRVNFVHIEIYKDANPAHGYAPAVTQWGLQTEPWVFVVNRAGVITAKFQGPTPDSELIPAIGHDLA